MQATQIVNNLYRHWSGNFPAKTEELPPSGSYRRYFRISDALGKSIIAAYNEDIKENTAFLTFAKHFAGKGLPVPRILAETSDFKAYLLDDLGDTMLLDFLIERNYHEGITDEIRNKYQQVIDGLLEFQIKGHQGLDYSVAYPRAAFDRQSMMWDLNYFKYYFLKLARVGFDEQAMEDDFNTLCDFLLSADCNYFLYRDFQSRNVMLTGENLKPYFIDFQGGRKGALYYDIASLLFEAKTDLPPAFRQEMMEYYLRQLKQYMPVEDDTFVAYYYGYAYIRTMQAMGAYGFRGLYEKKKLFLQSIPPVLDIIDWLTTHVKLPVQLPEMFRVWRSLVETKYIRELAMQQLTTEN